VLSTTRVGVLTAITAVSLIATACSSSKPSSAGAGAGQTSPGGAVTIETHSGPMGTYLTDGQGRSLYMFASDTSSKSTCTGACLSTWPAVTGTATSSGGANASLLGTLSGTGQVTYAGHPLYTYASDTSPGQTNGQGIDNFGAKWWLLAPSGQMITSTSGGSSSSSSSSSSSGGGGGGWS
jgi:predicted lipoprotein with Yx(FWY)xxD motif